MKPAAIVGLLIILSALAFGAKAFVTNLTPYLTFAQARQTQNGTVQIMGPLDKSSIQSNADGLRFVITSKDNSQDRMPVIFKESMPSNFHLAIEVTAIGRYTPGTTPNSGVFHADKLLVKCPSKYQGTETKEYGAK
ncbi:MAG: cytochrome c maturation protein CcmE [Fibrella sp.]|nr:cytochrome c maturation protein CcmE [Armatimonadota bacterium]